MGFKITINFFSINPISVLSIKGDFKTVFNKALLYTINFSHTDVQDTGDFFVG